MASFIPNSAKGKLGDGSIDWNTDTIKMALVTASYTPDQDAHDFFNEVTNEISSSGTYSTGGVTLTCSVTIDNTNNRAIYDASDVSITSFTGTFRYGIIYKSTGVSSTSPLIAVIDFTGSNITTTVGTFDVTWSTGGVFNLS